jgi:1-phosphofructokinase
MFGVKLTTDEEIVTYAKKLQEQGARNVLISMAGDGAILLTEDGRHFKSPAPKGTLVNSVGAGDSMVAGFIAGVDKGYGHALRLGLAAGGATAISEGLATGEQIRALMMKS